jgi:hypothetical protein
MRILALAVLAIGTVSAFQPAQAQTYDPNYPVCMHVVSLGAVYDDCSYYTLAQCNASASGRAAQCLVNPFFANAQVPVGRSYRHRRVY